MEDLLKSEGFLHETSGGIKDATKLSLFQHQRDAAAFAIQATTPPIQSESFALLLHAPGLGKTTTALATFALLQLLNKTERKRPARCVISAPPILLAQWKRTVEAWLAIPSTEIHMVTKGADITEHTKKAQVVIVSRFLVTRAGATMHEQARVFGVNIALLIIDEVHKMASVSSAVSASHRALSQLAHRRIGLSATPITNRAADLSSLCTVLGSGGDFGDRDFYLVDGKTSVVSRHALNALKTAKCSIAAQSLLGLPELSVTKVVFELDLRGEYVSFYNGLLKDAMTASLGRATDGKLTFALSRLQQICVLPELAKLGAHAFFKTYGVTKQIKTTTLSALEDLISKERRHDAKNKPSKDKSLASDKPTDKPAAAISEDNIGDGVELDMTQLDSAALWHAFELVQRMQSETSEKLPRHKTIVASMQVAPLRITQAYFRHKGYDGATLLLCGGMSRVSRERTIQKFLDSDACTVLFLSILCAGDGLHLVPPVGSASRFYCTDVVFFGPIPFTPAAVVQTSSRILRIGQIFPVKATHLYAKHSIDESIRMLHEDKERLSNEFLTEHDETDEKSELGFHWKTTSRLVDQCGFALEDGRLAPPKKAHGVSTVAHKPAKRAKATKSTPASAPAKRPRIKAVSVTF
jgi:SNF2 family DNA or RNA helicase